MTLLSAISVADLLEIAETHWVERGGAFGHHHTCTRNCIGHIEVLNYKEHTSTEDSSGVLSIFVLPGDPVFKDIFPNADYSILLYVWR